MRHLGEKFGYDYLNFLYSWKILFRLAHVARCLTIITKRTM